jgi:hypothetical protein
MTPSAGKIHAALVILLTLSACASTPPPRDALDSARVAVERAATASGQDEYRLADSRLRQAERAFAQREYALAEQLAEEARLAAQLAGARHRAAERRAEVEQRMAENARLRDDLQGSGGGR